MMSQSWDLLERKDRLQLEKCSGAQKPRELTAQVKAGVFMDVLTLGWGAVLIGCGFTGFLR
jgi:hypothetical protein